MAGMDGPRLTPKQERFVTEYLVDFNAAAAYRRAGYAARNDHAAAASAHKLLTKADIAAAVAAARAALSARVQVGVDDVVKGLHAEATFAGDGSSHSARVAAWAHLGKHLGMFADKKPFQVDVTSGGKPVGSDIATTVARYAATVAAVLAGHTPGVPAADGAGEPVDPV